MLPVNIYIIHPCSARLTEHENLSTLLILFIKSCVRMIMPANPNWCSRVCLGFRFNPQLQMAALAAHLLAALFKAGKSADCSSCVLFTENNKI